MKVIRLSSGLGNQLFMYSFYRYIENKYNEQPLFDDKAFAYDVSGRKSEITILYPDYPRYSFPFNPIGERGVRKHLFLLKQKLMPAFRFVTEDIYNDSENYQGKVHFNGYWQTDKYVSQIDRNLFLPKEEIPLCIANLEEQISKKVCPVAIHFRRGDYFSTEYVDRYGVCTIEYYHNAINKLKERIGDNVTFFVFSDDLEWVKVHIKFESDNVFIPNYSVNSFWYIHLMSKCCHNIISNSTFSWWGAYLNQNIDKIVIGPEKWTFDSDKNIMLDKWIKISV